MHAIVDVMIMRLLGRSEQSTKQKMTYFWKPIELIECVPSHVEHGADTL